MALVDAIQAVLTKGLDAAEQVQLAKLQINDPTGYVTGPNGTRVAAGQQSGIVQQLNKVPPLVWIAIIGVVGAVVLIPLLRR